LKNLKQQLYNLEYSYMDFVQKRYWRKPKIEDKAIFSFGKIIVLVLDNW
jgi:hypothetical protein